MAWWDKWRKPKAVEAVVTKDEAERNPFLPFVYRADPFGAEYCFVWSPAQWDAVCDYQHTLHPDEDWLGLKGVLKAGMTMLPKSFAHGPILIGVNMMLGPDWEIVSSIGTLSHEVSHAALFIARNINYNIQADDEPYCYLMQYMMSKGLWEMAHDWPTWQALAMENEKFLLDNARTEELELVKK